MVIKCEADAIPEYDEDEVVDNDDFDRNESEDDFDKKDDEDDWLDGDVSIKHEMAATNKQQSKKVITLTFWQDF